jgi:hypothetical protein
MWEGIALHGRSTRLKKIAGVALAILIVAALATVGWYFAHRDTGSPFPSAIRSRTQLTLFYPTTLPEGYVLDAASVRQTNDVITYVAKKSDKYINFSIQPRADTFDFTTFYSTVLVKSFKFTTPLGEATVGSMQSNGNTVGSLINGDTWVIVSAPADIKPSVVQGIISDFASASD